MLGGNENIIWVWDWAYTLKKININLQKSGIHEKQINECQEVAVGYKFCVSEGLDTLGDFMPEKKNKPYSNNKQSVHNGMPAR